MFGQSPRAGLHMRNFTKNQGIDVCQINLFINLYPLKGTSSIYCVLFKFYFKYTIFVDKFKFPCNFQPLFEYIQIMVHLSLKINFLRSPIFVHVPSRAQKI